MNRIFGLLEKQRNLSQSGACEKKKRWIQTGGDMVEGDAGAGEGMLDDGSDASGVAVGGDGNGAAVVRANEGGAYVLRDGVGIASFRHVTVLYVPPHRRLRRRVLHLCLRRRRSASSAHLIYNLIKSKRFLTYRYGYYNSNRVCGCLGLIKKERKGTVCDLTCLPLGFGIWNEGRDWKNGNRLDFLCSGLAPDGKVSKLYSTTLFRVSFPCGTSSFYFYLS